MKALRGSDGTVERPDSGAAIRLGEASETGEESPWGVILVIFMRLLAALWVLQGLIQWSAVLVPSEPFLDAAAPVASAAVIFFAVLDLVAAVGLWLATPWGGVLWLFSAVAQIFAAAMIPPFFGKVWIGVNAVLIVAYFVLTWQASHPGAHAARRKRR
ncbi:hypothetical protein [Methylocella tundrae]|uniref:Uncharacterized protein n=1 Tax=Methylocella tundrae TaxID=227605 RepID=A0A4U8YXJ8_METTU|nr:hypothetical protein [Methylocella tundrae]WPP05707.1 hypothetical protein SIN04_07815 [Methylocella tundrae]VFU08191.1 conserved membrane protein of unknown function [Methylocella tundrae]